MSRLISRLHPEFDLGYEVVPVWLTLLKQPLAVVQAGKPYWVLKTPRSVCAEESL
jgi:hypothetical protein